MPLSDEQIDQVLETLECATEENKVGAARAGQTVHLPAEGEIWVTGDLHDHRRNFEKFVLAADLPNNPRRHIVLHEIIHGDHFDENRAEDSWQMLVQAAALKCDYSSQVHFLFANHDLAQIHGEGIMKAGLSVCEAFNAGVRRDFGPRRSAVQVAITEFLLSLPLAIKTGNGLFLSHSLPGEDQVDSFDYSVFDRELTGSDYQRRTGAVYQLVWGRKTPPEKAAAFADRVGAQLLITGHQPQESGYAVNGERHLIIASDHNQGVFVPLSLAHGYDMGEVVGRIRKFVSIQLPEPPEPQTWNDAPPEVAPDVAEEPAPEAAADELVGQNFSPTISGDGAAGETGDAAPLPEPQPAEAEVPIDSAAQPPDPLPDEGQRAAICEMIAIAFTEIRSLAWDGNAAQAADLADVFHNVPREIYGRGGWNRQTFRSMLAGYQANYPAGAHYDYVAYFDQIMGDEPAATT